MNKKYIALFLGLGILIALSGVNIFLWWQVNKQTNINAMNINNIVDFINKQIEGAQQPK